MIVKRYYDKYNEIYNYEFLKEDNKLDILFCGNLDLYFIIYGKNINEFTITKENMTIYNLFDKLYSDIENINIYDEEHIPIYIETEEEQNEYLKERKDEYRLHNRSNYNELFNKENKTITWYSDETAKEVANYLKIIKEDEDFKLEFYTRPYIEGYDRDFNSKYSITIRFRNSGSRYKPFNACFMRLFNNLQKYDPDYHQITIEEYNQRVKKLKLDK